MRVRSATRSSRRMLNCVRQLPHPQLVRRPEHRQKRRHAQPRGTSSSGTTAGGITKSSVAPSSFHTPLLLQAMTRNR